MCICIWYVHVYCLWYRAHLHIYIEPEVITLYYFIQNSFCIIFQFSCIVRITLKSSIAGNNFVVIYVTQFAKTQHNDVFLEIQIFASVSSIYLKLCSVATPLLYCKYFSSYKAR